MILTSSNWHMVTCFPGEQPTSEPLAEPKDSQSQVKRMATIHQLASQFLCVSGMTMPIDSNICASVELGSSWSLGSQCGEGFVPPPTEAAR